MALAMTTTQGQQTPPANPPAPSAAPPAATSTDSHPMVSFQGTELHVGNLPPVSFHGFASQGFLVSDTYDYLGHTTAGSGRFSEFGLNASLNPAPRTRIAAQAFSYAVGQAGDYDVVLDYALAEYTFCNEVGIRAGRVRREEGIYNDIVDLDMARTWVLLPQGMYPAMWRDMYSTIDGGEVFGSLPLSKVGTVDYELYSGVQRPKLNGGLAAVQENRLSPLASINSPWLNGGQIWWNTPLNGLRLGAAVNYDKDVTYVTKTGRRSVGSPLVQHYSIDYNWHAWTFQAEYFTYIIDYHQTGGGRPSAIRHIEPDSWYVSAAYRFNKWFEAGSYYTEYYTDKRYRTAAAYKAHNPPGTPGSDAEQRDLAVALRFDPMPWWIIKVEGHMIQGTANLNNNRANPVRDDRWWPMLALKTSFTF